MARISEYRFFKRNGVELEMKKGDKIEEKIEGKGRIWGHVRISFGFMVGMYILSFVFTSWAEQFWFAVSWIAMTIFNFVNSIRHLRKYKEKVFAITSLVISSIFLLLMALGFMFGIIMAIAELI